MITRTSLFGWRLAPRSSPGDTQVRFGEKATARSFLPCHALEASGTAITSIATSAVTNPRPPLPHSTFERVSPPRLPVPHSALDRCSPRFPPFVRTFRSPFRALARAAFQVESHRPLPPGLVKTWRNVSATPRLLHPPAG